MGIRHYNSLRSSRPYPAAEYLKLENLDEDEMMGNGHGHESDETATPFIPIERS